MPSRLAVRVQYPAKWWGLCSKRIYGQYFLAPTGVLYITIKMFRYIWSIAFIDGTFLLDKISECISDLVTLCWIRSRVAIFSSHPRSIVELKNTRLTLEGGEEEQSLFGGEGKGKIIKTRETLKTLEPKFVFKWNQQRSVLLENFSWHWTTARQLNLGEERGGSQTKLQPIR